MSVLKWPFNTLLYRTIADLQEIVRIERERFDRSDIFEGLKKPTFRGREK